jgi:hypothetical protein
MQAISVGEGVRGEVKSRNLFTEFMHIFSKHEDDKFRRTLFFDLNTGYFSIPKNEIGFSERDKPFIID